MGSKVDRFPEIVKREAEEGHEVANHTYNHVYFNKKVDPERISEEIIRTREQIRKNTGQLSPLFRPPGGYYNDTIVKIARENGYTVVLWSWHQDTKDWKTPGVDAIVNKVLKNARNGDIVLFHDHVEGSKQTVGALERILPELQARGFKMVTVSELMRHKQSFPVKTGAIPCQGAHSHCPDN